MIETHLSVKGRRHHRKPFDPEDCLESHKTGLILVKDVKVGKKFTKTATKLTYLCTYCMWECHIFLGVFPGLAQDYAAGPPAENSSGARSQ